MAIRCLFEERLFEKMNKEKRRISLQEISEATGISKNSLSNLSKPSLTGINFKTLETLCRYFECGPGDLLRLE